MSKPPRIGVCIYCGSTSKKLEREHIVPEGLGNKQGDVLLDASCRDCAEVTSKFEAEALRGIFGNIRKAIGLKTKKGHSQASSSIKQEIIDDSGNKKGIEVGISEVFDMLFLPIFEPPAAIINDFSVVDCALRVDEPFATIDININNASKSHYKDMGYLKVETSFRKKAFERLLLKMAYCAAIKGFGYEALKYSHIPYVLLGIDRRYGTWLGCSNDIKVEDSDKNNIIVSYRSYEVPKGIVVAIRFFPHVSNSPEYSVIVKCNS